MVSTYNESDIQLAIRAHQRDPHVSILKLSKIYQVPNTTLRDRINGKPARRNTMPNSRKLTVSEENAIVSFIIDLDARSFPPRYSYVEDMANRLLAQRGGGDASGRTGRVTSLTAHRGFGLVIIDVWITVGSYAKILTLIARGFNA